MSRPAAAAPHEMTRSATRSRTSERRSEAADAPTSHRKGYLAVVLRSAHFVNVNLFRAGARCSSVVRAFAHGAMGRRIDPSWGEPIELYLVAASAMVERDVAPW